MTLKNYLGLKEEEKEVKDIRPRMQSGRRSVSLMADDYTGLKRDGLLVSVNSVVLSSLVSPPTRPVGLFEDPPEAGAEEKEVQTFMDKELTKLREVHGSTVLLYGRHDVVSFGSRKPDIVGYVAKDGGSAGLEPPSLTPSFIVIVGELKRRRAKEMQGRFTPEEKGQVLGMAQDLVREQAWRAEANAGVDTSRLFAFLSDGVHIVFFRCLFDVRIEGGEVLARTVKVEEWPSVRLLKEGGEVLAGIVRTPLSVLGYGLPSLTLMGREVKVSAFLGLGATSMVFSGVWAGLPVAAKLYSPAFAQLAGAEEAALDDLAGVPGVARLVGREPAAAGGREVLFTWPVAATSFTLTSGQADPPLGRDGQSRGLLSATPPTLTEEWEWDGPQGLAPSLSGALLSPLEPTVVRWPGAEELCDLLDALRELHACGWVHRDVRPYNWYRDTTGHFFLADLGSALHVGAVEPLSSGRPCGWMYGPRSVLEALARTDPAHPPAAPADDFEQVARVAFACAVRYADNLAAVTASGGLPKLLALWDELDSLGMLVELLAGARKAGASADPQGLAAFKQAIRKHII